jgi:outer membrane protein OmpA-like peptidoglycan-associated protein
LSRLAHALNSEETEMKAPKLLTLILSAAVAVPLVAQSNSAPGSQSSSVTDAATASGQPAIKDQPHDFWDGDEPGLAWLVLHPFASKAYVRRHVQPIQDRVNELNDLTASNAKLIHDVDARAQQGIQLASNKTTEADQHAMDASNKALAAQQAAAGTGTRLTTVEGVVGNIDQYKSSNQTVIRFHSGQSVLSKQAKNALDEMAANLKTQHGYVIEVQGFAPGGGQPAIAQSRKIADSVVRYLVLNHEIPAYRIYVVGMGNMPTTGEDGKRLTGSRVEVSLLKNDLDQLAAAPAK